MTRLAVLTSTVGSQDEARAIARSLVEARLAACVQVTPTSSIYRWDGAVEETSEWLLTAKIRADDYPAAEAVILTLHSYQVPEIIGTPIEEGFTPYCDWIAEATQR